MKNSAKISIMLLLSAGLFLLSSCSWLGGKTLKEGMKAYENESMGITLAYPETYTLEEAPNQVIIYHFKEQPAPYFTLIATNKTADELVKALNTEVLKDETIEKYDLDLRSVTTFNEKENSNFETYYYENEDNGMTYVFSCYGGRYDDVCETIEID